MNSGILPETFSDLDIHLVNPGLLWSLLLSIVWKVPEDFVDIMQT